ncbi:MAG: NPCBM/NEW2 domain-containing protein [Muribaculaceae bacterium]|nr:NPCBM/NEW2 domain-containing protein [Muribaculaceae bacterium]
MKIFTSVALVVSSALATFAAPFSGNDFKSWAPTPPMGWNSWDCYGPTVVESEVKANADYMAKNLKDYGWEYVVVDIRWFVENDKAGGYNQTNPIYDLDEWGRYIPAPNRFPSSVDGNGFKPLADYVHNLGLKFGIHIMRGIPKTAVQKKLPIKGTDGITADMVANNDSACTWLRDNMKVDWKKPGAQQYYNSIFDLYAQWGVDFVKVDDLSRPYHTAEVEMIRNAIDQCGRPMILSISPGETPLDRIDHVASHANMWRTVDDFWDNWSQLNYQFGICAKWAPYIAPGTWPDADMLPLGKISIRGERGAERFTNFTPEEQLTMMNLWTIFKSPLMFGGDLPQNDEATNKLLTNRDVLYMHSHSVDNAQLVNLNNHITWGAIDPRTGDRYCALFNTGGNEYVTTQDALWRSGTISYLTTGYSIDADVNLPEGSRQLFLVVTDGGDGYDSDHADWINPKVILKDGSEVDLTARKILFSSCGWGEVHVNSNIEGGSLKIDGKEYAKGIATHANSLLIFDLPENAVKFTALAGLDNTGTDQGSKSSVEFMVFNYDPTFRVERTDTWSGGDKEVQVDPTKQVAYSGYICREAENPVVTMEAPIKDAQKLYLVVTNGNDNLSYDHANWVNPVLVKANGEEVSLTDFNWDANPINGWNAPKKNKNNDGNQMSVGGVKYDKGFGVNAPSVLTFTLPEGHDFVTFRSLVGLDNDVDNAPFGATVEFRVFTEDPAPNNNANLTLDLALFGYEDSDKVEITDMWTGKNEGQFAGKEFASFLKEHGSALYRLKTVNRTQASAVAIEATEKDHGILGLKATVTDPTSGKSFVQFECDGNIIGSAKVGEDNTAVLDYKPAGGNHTYKAYYSGTLDSKNSVSDEIKVESAGVEETYQSNGNVTVIPGKGSVTVTAPAETILPIYSTDGIKVKSVKVASSPLIVNLDKGLYIIDGKTYNVL